MPPICNWLLRAVPRRVAMVCMLSISTGVGAAEDAESPAVTQLPTVEVTGSRLKRAQSEGPLPVTMIARAQIEQSGEISVADYLRDTVFNSFGSYTPTSGTGSGQGGAQLSLRGLGAGRTLVLIDGRRMPADPGGFGGATQNLNIIPLAIVERIELLRDGASAIYGSDAIGGVVNIITRRGYSGLQLGGQIDRPSARGGDAGSAVLSGGLSDSASELYFALDYYDKDIVYSRDRDVVGEISSSRGYPGTIYQYDADGQVVPQPSNPDASGRPRNFRPFDDCPTTGFGSDSQFPQSTVVNGACRYRGGAVAALTAALQRQSLTLGGRRQLTATTSAFARATMVSAESFGRMAATTVDSLVDGVDSPDANGNQGIRIDPDNPNNPNPGSTLVLNYRATVLGPRENRVEDQANQFLVGVRGRFDLPLVNDWELAAGYNDYRQNDVGTNYALASGLQAAVDAGRFNPFAPDPRAADEFRYTTTRDNRFRSGSIDGRMNVDLQIASRQIGTVFGFEVRNDDLAAASDAQSAQVVFFDSTGAISGFRPSNVLGAKGGSAQGRRAYRAAFIESGTTFFDRRVELDLALRFDGYSDVGSNLSEKLSVGYRPWDSLLLRGGIGSGFRAPDLSAMYGSPGDITALVIDRIACRDRPEDPVACATDVRSTVQDSNPALGAEQSHQQTLGLVWSASERLTLTLDYYAIDIKDAVTRLTPQAVFDNELRCDEQGRRCDARSEGFIVRGAGNSLLFAYAPAINATRLETDGIDAGFDLRHEHTRLGRFTLAANLSRVLTYRRQDAPGAPLIERLDTLNSGFEISPKLRADASLSWAEGRYSSALGLHYIGAVTDCDAPDRRSGAEACNNQFGDYRTVDLQFGVDTPWGQNLALGARNLFDEKPQVSDYARSASVPGIFYALHDADQRMLYLRVVQNF